MVKIMQITCRASCPAAGRKTQNITPVEGNLEGYYTRGRKKATGTCAKMSRLCFPLLTCPAPARELRISRPLTQTRRAQPPRPCSARAARPRRSPSLFSYARTKHVCVACPLVHLSAILTSVIDSWHESACLHVGCTRRARARAACRAVCKPLLLTVGCPCPMQKILEMDLMTNDKTSIEVSLIGAQASKATGVRSRSTSPTSIVPAAPFAAPGKGDMVARQTSKGCVSTLQHFSGCLPCARDCLRMNVHWRGDF